MKRIFILLILSVTLLGCAPNPKDVAKGEETRLLAEQDAADQAQEREHKIRMDEIELQEAEREQAVKDAALENAKLAAQRVAYWGGLALTLSIVLMILTVGASGSIAIYGSGKAIARAAMVKANLIYLDEATGQYPLVLEYAGRGIVSLTDPNTGMTLLLDTRNEADRLMIQSSAAVRHVGVLASAASKSKDPTGVAMIRPLVIEDVEAE